MSVLPASDRTSARPNFPAPSLKSAASPGLLALVPVWIVSALMPTLPDQSVGVAVAGSVSKSDSPFVLPAPELKFRLEWPVAKVSFPRLMLFPLMKSRKSPPVGAALLE